MTHNNKSDAPAVPTQSASAKQSPQKHSQPFYISDSLFQNKWLKQQRCQFLEARKKLYQKKLYQKKKARYLKKLAELKADVTINLLSDDEEEAEERPNVQSELQQMQQTFQQVIPLQLQFIPNDGSNTMQLSQIPNITLIPMTNLQAITMPLPKVIKRKNKRKTRPKKRPPATLNCTESIVLTDDDDDERVDVGAERSRNESVISQNDFNPQNLSHQSTPQPQALPQAPPIQLQALPQAPIQLQALPQAPIQLQALPQTPTTHFAAAPIFTQVDEEVSVSLVPRSKPSGTCSATNNKKDDTVFPMLPDETTVHTVIANRIYELSLSKLREGLATCGIPEFADEQQQQMAKSRRNTTFAPPMATPPPAPVSLKLSSDLSISLISDDEPEEDTITLSQLSPSLKIRTMHAAAELQQREQPQLQPLPLPLIANGNEANAHQKPRRRKLG